jgi:hypothetical protein
MRVAVSSGTPVRTGRSPAICASSRSLQRWERMALHERGNVEYFQCIVGAKHYRLGVVRESEVSQLVLGRGGAGSDIAAPDYRLQRYTCRSRLGVRAVNVVMETTRPSLGCIAKQIMLV